MRDLRAGARRDWSRRVVEGVLLQWPEITHASLLAGRTYTRYLAPAFERVGVTVTEPLAGLQVGERLAWLKGQGYDLKRRPPTRGDVIFAAMRDLPTHQLSIAAMSYDTDDLTHTIVEYILRGRT